MKTPLAHRTRINVALDRHEEARLEFADAIAARNAADEALRSASENAFDHAYLLARRAQGRVEAAREALNGCLDLLDELRNEQQKSEAWS